MAVTSHPGDGVHGVSRLHGCVQIQRKLRVSDDMLVLDEFLSSDRLEQRWRLMFILGLQQHSLVLTL